jgi:hypothetical protein
MADPFTIRIFVPDGGPEGVRIIDRMNWTGIGAAFPRSRWPEIKAHPEFARARLYVLVGQVEDDDLPTIYVSQRDATRWRIDDHFQKKDF